MPSCSLLCKKFLQEPPGSLIRSLGSRASLYELLHFLEEHYADMSDFDMMLEKWYQLC